MRTVAIYILISVFLFSCSKVELDKVENLNNGKIDIVAHGGSGFQSLVQPLPSNSFTGIQKTVDGLNADGIEIDVKVTVDSAVVLYHDDVLEKSTDCSGCPDFYSLDEILKCRYKNYYGSRAGKDEYIISFAQLIDYFKNRTDLPHIYVNTKIPTSCSSGDSVIIKRSIAAVVTIIAENNAYSWISIYDGNPDLLNMVRSMDNKIDLILNVENFDEGINVAKINNYSGVVIKNSDVTKEQVRYAHSNNIKVTIWGVVLRKEHVDAVNKNPDAIMTDNVPLLIQILNSK